MVKNPQRQPDYKKEAETLAWLAQKLSDPPQTMLQAIADAALDLCGADSSGVTILEQEGKTEVFRWRSLAGNLSSHLGRIIARDASPCGIVIDTAKEQLFDNPSKQFSYLGELGFPIHQLLLVPFYQNGKPVGTVWIATHSDAKKIDQEDVRLLSSLTKVTAAGYEVMKTRDLAQKNETFTRDLLNSTAEGIWGVSELGAITFVNTASIEMFGFTEEEMIGKNVHDLVHHTKADGSPYPAHECPNFETFKRGEQLYLVDEVLWRKDGTPIFCDYRSTPIFDNGRMTGAVVTFSDTTERKRAIDERKKLQTENEDAKRLVEIERAKLANIFEQAPFPLVAFEGPDHRFLFTNAVYRKQFIGEQNHVGRKLDTLLPQLRAQGFGKELDNVYQTGKTFVGSEWAFEFVDPNGTPLKRYYNFVFEPLKQPTGAVSGVLAAIADVTEQVLSRKVVEKAKEEAEAANAAKSAFLANMSHEIRTPLGAIMGFVDLIKNENIPRAELEDYLSVIDRNSNQLLRIIDDILDLSKVEAGMLIVEQVEFSLVELLTDFASLMRFRARDKGIMFDVKARTELPEFIVSDPTRIKQILANIVGNAIKFTEQGRVDLFVSYEESVLEFEVRDTGRGISAEQERGLFQPFSQGDVSVTRKFGGTGLGLVLTRRLSELLGGSFLLKESAVGKGSTFVSRVKVELPRNAQLVKALGYATAPDRGNPITGRLQGMNILVVEDSPDNQALISILLSKAGAAVEIADDGEAGIEAALGSEFDVVLMDVQMPRMDGISAIRVLRERGYKKPVIALTAHAMKEERERCIDAGYTDFLSKPIQREALFNLLAQTNPPSTRSRNTL